ncbi:MAG: type II toxin-antitoxin system VapC family toxin [Acidobacteria bacterium]|nr:type II toxin-antitoxin system VapC family toxin [Acidobacteriota bacterium]
MLVLDTHVLVDALAGDITPKELAVLSREEWSISAISLWEIAKLTQLNRLEMDLEDAEVTRALARIHTWPLTLEICRASTHLDFHGDSADELIAATSLVHGAALATRDRQIRRSKQLTLALGSLNRTIK